LSVEPDTPPNLEVSCPVVWRFAGIAVQGKRAMEFLDVRRARHTHADRELFARRLRDFVPTDAFDAHAHLYDLRHFDVPAAKTASADLDTQHAAQMKATANALESGQMEIDCQRMIESMRRWMGDRVIRDGLYFPYPSRHLDIDAANEFVARAIAGHPGSRALMLIRPDQDPVVVESTLRRRSFAGFKVYHVFAGRDDTFAAEPGEFVPVWAWELADQYGLWITLHLVRPNALADELNLAYVQSYCHMYPNARLVLAHAARGFNARHIVDAIDRLRGIDNVFFDTSAVCEPSAFEAIIRATGTTRLMYGSDFPVSEWHGRSLSLGDGFYWLYETASRQSPSSDRIENEPNVRPDQPNSAGCDWPHGRPTLVGIESLLALRQACRTMGLRAGDVERIFAKNARQLLGIDGECGIDRERGSCRHADGPFGPNAPNVQSLYQQAKQLIPGGTQLLSKRPEMFAPNQWPAYYEQAIGCEIVDSDGRRYIDMSHCGILSCILGFADPEVNAAVIRRVHLGGMSSQQTADEVDLARLLVEIHPWAQQARFTRSGGEAMAVAVRIARAATGRDAVIICGYHGWHDWYLAANLESAPTGPSARAQQSLTKDPQRQRDHHASALDVHLLPGLRPTGVPRTLAGTVATFSYGRLDELDAALARFDNNVAAIVLEPTRSEDPPPGFLEGVRQRADRSGARLIFDEISAGWRLCLGGAHRLYGVNPDMAVFAKAMSNGFAMGAVIGRRSTMQAAEDSFISSTYWTEGIGPAAALATIRKMMRIDVPAHLRRLGTLVQNGWRALAERHQLPLMIHGRPDSCTMRFNHPDHDALATLLTTLMLDRCFLAATTCSLTLAHQPHHVDRYLGALDCVFADLANAIAAGNVKARLRGPVKDSTFRRLVN
jgi:glutamate-1-semialdehyde 2,1-aminomutase